MRFNNINSCWRFSIRENTQHTKIIIKNNFPTFLFRNLNCSANKNQSDGIDFLVVEQERVNQLDNCDISKDGISKSTGIRKLEQMTRLFSDFKR